MWRSEQQVLTRLISDSAAQYLAGDENISKVEVDSELKLLREQFPVEKTWSAALRDLSLDDERRAAMRAAALDYGVRRLASWGDVLKEDLLPGWRAAAKVF